MRDKSRIGNNNNKNASDNNSLATEWSRKNLRVRFNCRYYRQNAFCGVNQSAFCSAPRYLLRSSFFLSSVCVNTLSRPAFIAGVRMFAPILSSICMLPFVNSEFVTNKRFFLLNARFFHSFTFFSFFALFSSLGLCVQLFLIRHFAWNLRPTDPFNAMYTVIIFPFDFFFSRSIPNSQFSSDVCI